MFKKIFLITSLLLGATLVQPSLATACSNGKCGVVVFENTTWSTISGVTVYDTVTGEAIAGSPNLPPKAILRVYFNDKTTHPLRFSACRAFAGLPLGCINFSDSHQSPSTSCPYPRYKTAKIYFIDDNNDQPYVICK